MISFFWGWGNDFFFCFLGEGLACFGGKEDLFLGERAKTWGKEEGSGGRVKKKEIEKKEKNGRKRGKRRRKRGEGGDDSRGRR